MPSLSISRSSLHFHADQTLAVLGPAIFPEFPEFMRLRISEMKTIYALAAALISTWKNYEAVNRTITRGSLSSMLSGIVITIFLVVKYLAFSAPASSVDPYFTQNEVLVVIFEMHFETFLLGIQLALISKFNQGIRNGNYRQTSLAVDPDLFMDRYNQAKTDNRLDAAVSLIQWASSHHEIAGDRDSSFLVSLNSCFLEPGLIDAKRYRLLRVLFSMQPKPTPGELVQCPELAMWIETLSALQLFGQLHKLVSMLDNSPVFPLDETSDSLS